MPLTEPINRIEIISDAIQQRQNEILMYDINIVNYETILLSMEGQYTTDSPEDVDMREYRTRISELLRSEKREQAKTQLVLDALQNQLAAKSQ